MAEVLWTSKDAEKATSGKANKSWNANSVSIDSRSVKKGDLFIAIKGENFDGHDYVQSALKSGASAAVVSYVKEDWTNLPLLIVKDTFQALWDLAKFSRSRFKGKVFGVTGSVGKTSVKEMLKCALEANGEVFASEGNYNNHFGLPLSLSRLPDSVDYAIFEMGMNHKGEIEPLSNLAKPDVAIITTVEAVHLEFFDSVKDIAMAKSEIFSGVPHTGAVVLNRDNQFFDLLKSIAKEKGIKNIACFGAAAKSDYRLKEYKNLKEGCSVKADLNGKAIEYNMGISGEHQAKNSLAVLAAADMAGADVKKAAGAFTSFAAKDGRGRAHEVKISDIGKITLIDDTYNASYASISAALENLSRRQSVCGGRTVAVLGDMFELGDESIQIHKNLSKNIVENNIDLVFTAGNLMESLFAILPEKIKARHCKDSASVAPEVLSLLKDGDLVLVKGSRGMKMEKVINYILQEEKQKDAV